MVIMGRGLSYTVKYLKDATLVRMNNTMEYEANECVPNSTPNPCYDHSEPVTEYSRGESNNVTIRGNGGSTYSWQHDAGFDVEKLKALGYSTVTVSLSYQSRANGVVIGAESKAQVYGGHGVNNNSWISITRGHSAGSNPWREASQSRDLSIDDFNNLFTVYFHSTHVADHTVGQRTVTVTAKK